METPKLTEAQEKNRELGEAMIAAAKQAANLGVELSTPEKVIGAFRDARINSSGLTIAVTPDKDGKGYAILVKKDGQEVVGFHSLKQNRG